MSALFIMQESATDYWLSGSPESSRWYLNAYSEMSQGRVTVWDGQEYALIGDGIVGPIARWQDDGGA